VKLFFDFHEILSINFGELNRKENIQEIVTLFGTLNCVGNKRKEVLKEYYSIRGWSERGLPTKEKLRELQIEDLANGLEL
jgi:hypothetical protein